MNRYRIETVYRMRTVRDLAARAARPRAFRTTERRARAARANAQAVACVNAPARSVLLVVNYAINSAQGASRSLRDLLTFFA